MLGDGVFESSVHHGPPWRRTLAHLGLALSLATVSACGVGSSAGGGRLSGGPPDPLVPATATTPTGLVSSAPPYVFADVRQALVSAGIPFVSGHRPPARLTVEPVCGVEGYLASPPSMVPRTGFWVVIVFSSAADAHQYYSDSASWSQQIGHTISAENPNLDPKRFLTSIDAAGNVSTNWAAVRHPINLRQAGHVDAHGAPSDPNFADRLSLALGGARLR